MKKITPSENQNQTITKLVSELVQLSQLKDPSDVKLLHDLRAAKAEIKNLHHIISTKQVELDSLSDLVMRQGSELQSRRRVAEVYQEGFDASQKVFAPLVKNYRIQITNLKHNLKELKNKLSGKIQK